MFWITLSCSIAVSTIGGVISIHISVHKMADVHSITPSELTRRQKQQINRFPMFCGLIWPALITQTVFYHCGPSKYGWPLHCFLHLYTFTSCSGQDQCERGRLNGTGTEGLCMACIQALLFTFVKMTSHSKWTIHTS